MKIENREKMVYAHLCTWFKTREYSGHWEMWNSEYEQTPHNPEMIFDNGHRDIASTNYPLTDVYDSSDPNVIEYQFLLMKISGIDGVIVDWDGRRLNEYRHQTLMDIVPYLEKFKMKLIICFEEWCGYYPKGYYTDEEEIKAAQAELQWMFDELGSKPFYGTVNGKKPVLIFRKMPDSWFNAKEWEGLSDIAHKENGTIIFPDYYDQSFNDVIDGAYFWIGGFTEKNRNNTLEFCEDIYKGFFMRNKDSDASSNKFFKFGSVVPGFDDTPVWGWGELPRIAPRYDGSRYEKTWEMCIENDVDLVQIVTWNDWNEGSHIEPADTFGYKYLELNKKYSAKYKGKQDNIPNEALRIPLKIFEARKNALKLTNVGQIKDINTILDEVRDYLLEDDYQKAVNLIENIDFKIKK